MEVARDEVEFALSQTSDVQSLNMPVDILMDHT